MTHTGDCDGGFGNVGRENDFARVVGTGKEDALLLARGEGGVEGEYKDLRMLEGGGWGGRGRKGYLWDVFLEIFGVFFDQALEGVDFLLTGEEDKDVAGEGLGHVDLEDCAQGGVDVVLDRLGGVEDVDGVLTAGDLEECDGAEHDHCFLLILEWLGLNLIFRFGDGFWSG